MDVSVFKESLGANEPPQNLSVCLKALWFDARGEWDKAHDLIQGATDTNSSWIHAYLHRKEGDETNAAYWYNRAGKKVCHEPLENELDEIVAALG
ncbi:MAG: hypothetical protein WKI04_01395 [Ferruginibacter sp.]